MGGVEWMDDNIYGVLYRHNKWFKIDIATEATLLVGDDSSKYRNYKYNGDVIGEDCNIYTIPADAKIVTKFNTATQKMSEVRYNYCGDYKWSGGVLHSNGYIYCAPFCNNKL